jgi:hypothetical protein
MELFPEKERCWNARESREEEGRGKKRTEEEGRNSTVSLFPEKEPPSQ